MTRLGGAFWLVLALVAGFTTFKVKYAVQDVEDELHRARKQTVAEQQEIRVLNAEWTYLTQPERLAELNRRFLGLATLSAKQLQRGIDEIPLRASPPAEALAEPKETIATLVAAVADGSVPATAAPTALPILTAARGAVPSAPAVDLQIPAAPPVADRQPRPTDNQPLRLATAGAAPDAAPLDALIARIAETR